MRVVIIGGAEMVMRVCQFGSYTKHLNIGGAVAPPAPMPLSPD